MNRQFRHLVMKDIIDHLAHCHEKWQVTETRRVDDLADAIERDLNELRQHCHALRPRPVSRPKFRRGAVV